MKPTKLLLLLLIAATAPPLRAVITCGSPIAYSDSESVVIYSPESYGTLHLHDRVIDKTVSYKARKIILGENVTVKAGVSLTLTATEEIEVRPNVKCEPGAI